MPLVSVVASAATGAVVVVPVVAWSSAGSRAARAGLEIAANALVASRRLRMVILPMDFGA